MAHEIAKDHPEQAVSCSFAIFQETACSEWIFAISCAKFHSQQDDDTHIRDRQYSGRVLNVKHASKASFLAVLRRFFENNSAGDSLLEVQIDMTHTVYCASVPCRMQVRRALLSAHNFLCDNMSVQVIDMC